MSSKSLKIDGKKTSKATEVGGLKSIDGRNEMKKGENIETAIDKQTGFSYHANKVIGKGTFGVVYQGSVVGTKEIVAIKKVFQDKRFKNRELPIIKELNHPNCIRLKHSFYTTGESVIPLARKIKLIYIKKLKENEVFLNLVMDFMPENLFRIVKYYKKQKQPMPNILIKIYSYQLLRGLAYIHALGICHRDIKPHNILVDPSTHELKLCDFGSAKKLVKDEANISYICSRYYRAPELIFGATDYTSNIDIWAIGCVIAEMILTEPLFPGDSAVDQLVEIIKILGTPNPDDIKCMNQSYENYKFPQVEPVSWNDVFKDKSADPWAIDLVSKLLVYKPNERIKPIQGLLHPFFLELRNQNCTLNNNPLPDLFNFSKEEMTQQSELIGSLIPTWYKPKK